MTTKEKDIQYMQRAIQLAELGGVSVAPNPMVGAVVVHNDKIIGEGYHKQYGTAHAEVNAINEVKNKEILSEATIYVTLEPCSHQGKTPPCSDLIIHHKFKRVVIACLDTNEKVSGKGVAKLKSAGIQVEVGVLEEEARWLNRRFFTFHEKKRPYVVLKWAETRDGFMDRLPEERNSGINWITSPRMKLFVHTWRSKEPAIMVGWKTINNDNPQLTVRAISGQSPHRFIIDPNGNANPKATVFNDGLPTTVISHKEKIEHLSGEIKIITLQEISATTILKALFNLNYSSVFIEGGANTLSSFIEEHCWDEAYQLIGDVVFHKGLPAPILKNKVLLEEERFGKDSLRWYKVRKLKVESQKS